jgi:CRP-like cAMP-binding protein
MTVSSLSPPRSPLLMQLTYNRRSLLSLDHNYLWRIEAGIVRTLTVSEAGNTIILGLWGPGDVVGRVLSKADSYQIECLTPVKVVALPPHRWHEAAEAMISHIQRSGELMEILHCRQAEVSLLQLFTWLAKRFGQAVKQGQLIDLRLTHQDIADLLGITRVTVTRLVNEFEKQGMIQRIHRQFIVLDDRPPFWHYEI